MIVAILGSKRAGNMLSRFLLDLIIPTQAQLKKQTHSTFELSVETIIEYPASPISDMIEQLVMTRAGASSRMNLADNAIPLCRPLYGTASKTFCLDVSSPLLVAHALGDLPCRSSIATIL